jgi:threonine/homoserine/homoserine lactone efflux protein
MLAFILFAFVASVTPGPTNLIVLSTSARRGWRPCLPIILGAERVLRRWCGWPVREPAP